MTSRTRKSAKIAMMEIADADRNDDTWRLACQDGAVTVGKRDGFPDIASLSSDDGSSFHSDVCVTGVVKVPSRAVLPSDGTADGDVDYSKVSSQCLVPKSRVDATPRRPAFVHGTRNALIVDARVNGSINTGNMLSWVNGKWGAWNIATAAPNNQLVFCTPFSIMDAYYEPEFRTARFGSIPWQMSGYADFGPAVVRNAFPTQTAISITEARVSVHNLQLASTAGGTCKIHVTLRILDSAVDTGLYENEVYREFDLTQPDEFVNVKGLHSDGRWNWKSSRNMGKPVDVSSSAAIRVQMRIALTEFNGQTNPLTVYSSRKNAATASELYTKSGAAATDLAAYGAFPITGGDGVVGTGPLTFSGLADGTHYVYVIAKGSSGAFSSMYEHAITVDAKPHLVTSSLVPNASPVTVQATFSGPVTGFALGDISVTNGTASNLTGSGASYSFSVTPDASYAPTTVSVAADAVAFSNGDGNTAATPLTFTHTPYDPAADADVLAWYDASDQTTLFTDVAGTAMANDTDRVALVRDKSPNGLHVTQTASSIRPRNESSGIHSRRALRFNHAGEHLVADNIWVRPDLTAVIVAKQNTGYAYPATATSGFAGYMLGAGVRCVYSNTSNVVFWIPKTGVYETTCNGAEFFDDQPHVFAMSLKTSESPATMITRFDGRAGTNVSGTIGQPVLPTFQGVTRTMSVRTSTRSVKISTLEISDNADDAWRVQRTSDGAITARKVGGVDEPVWVSADLAEFRSDVRVAGDAAIPSRLVLPSDGAAEGEMDYATAQSSCLVPKSVVDDLTRRPAFVLGTNHASVTDTRYTVSPAADNKLSWVGGKWGPYNVNLSNPTGQIVFRVPLSGGDVYAAPVFRTAYFGAPAGTTGAVVENAFPSATTLAVTGAHVSLHNLQLSSEGGGTCKIQVSLRILDVAVDTGRYENEVFRELDLTQPDEFVNAFGLYADGRWIWKNSRTLTKRVDVGISAAVRVQIKVALTEFGAQTDPLTYATIRLDTTPATFATDAFAGSVSAPTVVGRTLSVTHGITQTAGSNMGVACRVYTSRKNAATAEELYTKSGTAGSDLVTSGAFPITGTAGAVGTGPLSFSELADGTYYVYVVAKGLTPRTPDPVARPVTATFTRAVTGFVLGDITVTNGIASDFVAVDTTTYTFNVTPTMANILTTVNVGANTATDTLTGFGNAAATPLNFTYSYDPSADTALYAWYDPSDGTTLFGDTTGTAVQSTAGGNVLRMNDKKNLASGYHVSQSNAALTPILDTTQLNGKTSLRFINNRSGNLESASTFWDSIGTNTSVIVVARQLSSTVYPGTGSWRGYIIGTAAGYSGHGYRMP
eukprot:jgi/Mesvir1/11023/Mv21440-RA.1